MSLEEKTQNLKTPLFSRDSPPHKIICANKMYGGCPHCTPDFDTNHHPNNYDCQNFYQAKVYQFSIK